MARAALPLFLALAFAAPAAAEPVLLTAPGTTGAVIPYGLKGRLGTSGIAVAATPTMILVTGVSPGSPAALADVPVPGEARVRLAAIDGRPVENYQRHELLQCFNPARGSVSLTFGKKTEGEPAETLVGPYVVALAAGAIAERQADWLARQGRYDQVFKLLKERPQVAGAIADQLLLAAQDAARAGDHARAIALAAWVPPPHAGHAEARRLMARARLTQANEALHRADALATDGQYEAALAALRAVPDEGAWRKLRQAREAGWRAAIASRAANRKVPARRR